MIHDSRISCGVYQLSGLSVGIEASLKEIETYCRTAAFFIFSDKMNRQEHNNYGQKLADYIVKKQARDNNRICTRNKS